MCSPFPLPPGRNSHRIPRNKRHVYSATVFLNLPHSRTRRRRKKEKNFPLSKLFFTVFISPSSSLLFLSAFEEYGTHEKRASHKPGGERRGETRACLDHNNYPLYDDERRTDWKRRKKKRGKSWEKEMRRRIFRAKFLPKLRRGGSGKREGNKNYLFCGSCFARLQSA